MIEFNATFIIAMLSFVAFICIMNTIFYKPILSIIKKREEYILSNNQESEQLEKTANEFKQTHATKIEEKHYECRTRLKNIIDSEQNKASEEIKTAKENSKNEILKQREELHKQEENLRATLKSTVIDNLASDITNKITKGVLS